MAKDAPAAESPTANPPDGTDAVSFEVALDRLEKIVDRLERGELELEEALRVFEEGVALTRQCAGQLEGAERRIEVLVREGEQWVSRPFEEPEEEA